MNLNKLIFTDNDCYLSGRTINPKGVMIHSTGANNPSLKRYVGPDDGQLGVNRYGNHWNNPNIPVCVHGFIGKLEDGTIATYQTLPWNHRAWHCGGAGNNTHISFEICEDDLSDFHYFTQTYEAAVVLTAQLCDEFQLNPLDDGVVICHYEGKQRNIASNHRDIIHWWNLYGKTMDDFRNDIVNEMEITTVTQSQFDTMLDNWLLRQKQAPISAWATTGFEKANELGITDGTCPQSFATRQEVVQMLMNTLAQ